MNRKICNTCRKKKPSESFYDHPNTADGLMEKCKECHKLAMKKNRRENPAVQAYERERAKTPKRRAYARKLSDRWNLEHPDGYRAHNILHAAVRDGKIKKRPCSVCGSTKNIHGHHADYSKPLKVKWLCALHHHRCHADGGKTS
jgi:hypothetical protein